MKNSLKILVLIWLMSLFMQSIYGQEFCGTSASPDYLESVPNNLKNTSGPYFIKVFGHIIRRSDGSGGITIQQMNNAIDLLTSDLSPHNICIIKIGYSYIDSDNFYYGDMFDIWPSIFNTNTHDDAIDIYFASDETGAPGGTAGSINSKSLVYGGEWYSYYGPSNAPPFYNLTASKVISHEMGHCLGLYHTHEKFFCIECPDGSNSLLCGDKIQDTPADPNLFFGNNLVNCNWNCLQVNVPPPYLICNHPNCNYMAYNPIPTNIMSYAYPTCLNAFTIGQGQRMRDVLNVHPLFSTIKVHIIDYVQNKTINESRLLLAQKHLMAGKQVNMNQPLGWVNIINDNYVSFHAMESINLEEGVVTNLTGSGKFVAEIRNDLFCNLQSLKSTLVNNYKVFLKNSQWFYKMHTIDGPIYCLSGWPVDTIINGLSYKKSNIVVTSPTPVMPGILPPHGTLEGYVYLREDTIARRVYHFNQNSQTDQLLFDFSLSIGDSMPVAFNPEGYVLTAVDSVLLNNGEYHRRFVFTGSSGNNVYWVEGVGNLDLPHVPSSGGGLSASQWGLICSYQDGLGLYDAGNIPGINCSSLLTTNHQTFQPTGIKLIPNPSITKFRIEVNDPFPQAVSVTDVTGRFIYRNHFSPENSIITVDCSHWQSGIYFVKVGFKEHEVIKKFIRIE